MTWHSQRRHFLPPQTKTGMRGVIFCPNLKSKPWKAYIRQSGLYKTLGYYATKEEAAHAYNVAAVKLLGTATFLNPLPKTV